MQEDLENSNGMFFPRSRRNIGEDGAISATERHGEPRRAVTIISLERALR